jgi:hypothetical protein
MTMNDDGIGAAVRLFTTEADDLGTVTAPAPVEPDDVVALEHGPPLRILCVAALDPGGRVDYIAEVDEARLPLVE